MQNKEKVKKFLRKGCHSLYVRMAVLGVAALAWWGVLYPELCFMENTCVRVIVSRGQEIVIGQTDCQEILKASGDEMIIRSRLLEWLEERRHKK